MKNNIHPKNANLKSLPLNPATASTSAKQDDDSNVNFSLSDIANYNTTAVLNETMFASFCLNYKKVTCAYVLLFFETNHRFYKNEETRGYFSFLLLRGLTTITYVFHITFLHSRNVQMAFYHSQRAYYYYIEFMNQIVMDTQSFLRLSSRDAILFVYKKTLFDLCNLARTRAKPNETAFFVRCHKWSKQQIHQLESAMRPDASDSINAVIVCMQQHSFRADTFDIWETVADNDNNSQEEEADEEEAEEEAEEEESSDDDHHDGYNDNDSDDDNDDKLAL